MAKRILLIIGLVTVTLAAFSLDCLISPGALAQNQVSPEIAAREVSEDGRSVGEVLVDGQVVLRMRSFAGGMNPVERAQLVADRLRDLRASGELRPENIRTGIVNGQRAVLAGNQVIVTADREQALMNDTNTAGLANLWAARLRGALDGRPLSQPGGVGAATPRAIPTASKIVPILSVGSGTRIGGAQVTGPRNRVDDVRAVAQIEGQFGNAVRARVLVPVSTENVIQDIARVPGTSVTALVDIGL